MSNKLKASFVVWGIMVLVIVFMHGMRIGMDYRVEKLPVPQGNVTNCELHADWHYDAVD
jgi:hypothetical protein